MEIYIGHLGACERELNEMSFNDEKKKGRPFEGMELLMEMRGLRSNFQCAEI
jgi:hypothetical protein